MDKVYTINEYAKKTLEGLGYEVNTNTEGSMTECFQGVRTLIDKSTGKSLPSERGNILDLSEEEWESGMAQFLNGTPTDIYQGKNSERIELSKYGETDIIFNNGLRITFPNHDKDSKEMNIKMVDSENRIIEITYYGLNYDYPQYNFRRNSIIVSVGFPGENIAHIEQSRTMWRDYSKRFEISECTPQKVTKQLISRIRTHQKGKYWNKEFKQGLEVIAPAIALMVIEFKKGWMEQIIEFVDKETKDQKKAKQSIDALIEQIANSQINVVELVRAHKEIANSLEPKQLKKKRNEVQQG